MAAGALALAPLIAADRTLAAEAFIVHAINGEDLGADEEFPVDILIDLPPAGVGPEDICITDVEFTDDIGPQTLEAGLYTVELHEAGADCEGLLVVANVLSISSVGAVLIVAQTDAQGAPLVKGYTLNFTPLADNEAS